MPLLLTFVMDRFVFKQLLTPHLEDTERGGKEPVNTELLVMRALNTKLVLIQSNCFDGRLDGCAFALRL